MSKIALNATVKCPVAQLRQHATHHLNLGVSRIYYFFDDPNDPAIDAFEDYPEVICTPCSESHWAPHGGEPDSIEKKQKIHCQLAAKWAIAEGCTWICNLDQDELLYTEKNLIEVIQAHDVDLYIPEVYEAVCTKMHYQSIFHTTYFKTPTTAVRSSKAKKMRCRRAFLDDVYYRGHTASKAIVRLSDKITYYRTHRSDGENLTKVRDRDVLLLHFDGVGFESWNQKWRARYNKTANFTSMIDKRNAQFDMYCEAAPKGPRALKKSYRRLYCLPIYHRLVLSKIGVLTKIKVNRQRLNERV